MTDIASMTTSTRTTCTVTRGQVAKAVLALTRVPAEMTVLADMLGYADERTYRAVGALRAVNGAVGR